MREKLSQDEILELMSNGWELGRADGTRSNGYFWLQQGGLCCGGKSKDLHANTVYAMLRKGTIKQAPKRPKDQFWLKRYVRTSEATGATAMER